MTRLTCPDCSTEYIKRARRESLKERLLSLVYVYPYFCQLCGHRFRSLQWGVKYSRIDEDRRIYQRLPVSFSVAFVSDGIKGTGLAADVSMAGCALQTATKIQLGAILRVSLHVAENTPPIAVEAAVVRDARRNRVGIEFLQVKKIERDRLRDFIGSLLLKQQSKREDENRARKPAVSEIAARTAYFL